MYLIRYNLKTVFFFIKTLNYTIQMIKIILMYTMYTCIHHRICHWHLAIMVLTKNNSVSNTLYTIKENSISVKDISFSSFVKQIHNHFICQNDNLIYVLCLLFLLHVKMRHDILNHNRKIRMMRIICKILNLV